MNVISMGTLFLNVGINSFLDIKFRRISVIVCLVCGSIGVLIKVFDGDFNFLEMMFGTAPGLFLILVSIFSKGKVGMGDGILLLSLGTLIKAESIIEILIVALILTSMFSVVLIVIKRANLKSSLPFVPFLLLSCIGHLFWS